MHQLKVAAEQVEGHALLPCAAQGVSTPMPVATCKEFAKEGPILVLGMTGLRLPGLGNCFQRMDTS